MWRKRLKYALLFGFCLLLLLLFPSCTPAYAAGTYTITAEQLTRLETNLKQLETNSQRKQTLLESQSDELKRLNERLKQSLQSNEETQKLLQNAEESLKTYEAEQQRKAAIKDRQRNAWAAAAGIALAWACVK